jgi:hypothetical protein
VLELGRMTFGEVGLAEPRDKCDVYSTEVLRSWGRWLGQEAQ